MQRAIVHSPVAKAIWFIESHSSAPITLDDVADACGVSRFHLVRAFAATTGMPVVRYLRSRRLSEAARKLADGAPDILEVAMDAGYGSHEAFTRAFRDEFSLTPERCRERRDLTALSLTEALRMDPTTKLEIEPDRIVEVEPRLIAGIGRHYARNDMSGIPAQWQEVNAQDAPAGRADDAAYGVCYNADDVGNMDYLAGFAVTDFTDLPHGFDRIRLPGGRYAVFRHEGHVSSISQTWSGIFEHGLPESRHKLADGPSFERYGPRFDPRTGLGGFEIWIPLEAG